VQIARDGSHTLRVVDAERRLRALPIKLVRLVDGYALVAGDIAPRDLVVAAGGQHVAAGTRVQTRLATR
jgi:1,4-dihydroxy-2-naphthoyl-CoA synthase